ncbi:MAG: class I SAM-dependent methyltransferase [Candidatus Scalindua sp.]|nr:class I SAM-dependent methyltransferase [Candidatus Scalindua sp.]
MKNAKCLMKLIRQKLFFRLSNWLCNRWVSERSLPVGGVHFGNLRRVEPISRNWGYDRGLPIDRYYIEAFLYRCSSDIRGRVLEIGDNSYSRRFGENRVTTNDVLHVVEGNPNATVVADLTCAEHIASNIFDCIILTQTLQLIYDVRAALRTLYRILKPGGVLLTTFPGITKISNREWTGSWFWGFTSFSAQRLFEETFPSTSIKVEAQGNVLAAIAFLHGLSVEELRQEELDYFDPEYEVSIAVRAAKPEALV